VARFGSFLEEQQRERPNGCLCMGILFDEDDGYQESVVFFLSEALRAAIEIGDGLQQSVGEVPVMQSGMTCVEIAEQLAAFRKRTQNLWGQEVLMAAKIMRARDLCKELRELNPELKPEIDTFRLATTSIPEVQEMLLPTADYFFNGAMQPKRFLEERGHGAANSVGHTDPIAGYMVAGHTDVRLLLTACETLHFGLAAHYGFDALPSRSRISQIDEPLLLDDEVDSTLLLTDLCDILSEPLPQWLTRDREQPRPN